MRRPSPRQDRAALITGASRGLGLALARELARRGWKLIIAFFDVEAGERLRLSGGGEAYLCAPYGEGKARLWVAALELPLPVEEYLERHGFPIRYEYAKENWPLEYYQTTYASESGSAEMP